MTRNKRAGEGTAVIEVPKGLERVIVADTGVGEVRGQEGFYHYREYSAVELAASRSFEDVVHLLIEGGLPASAGERERYRRALTARRVLPAPLPEILPSLAVGDPMAALRTAISLTGATLGWHPLLDLADEAVREQIRLLIALVPTLLATTSRLQQGLDPVPARDDLSHAANYLWMLLGEEPAPELARALEQYLILVIDHGFNASTFAARVIASTGTDLASAVCGALGALAGPLHGGAPSRALDMLDQVRATGDAARWVTEIVERGERVMGFGHRVYRTEDPRAVFLRQLAADIGGPLGAEAISVEQTVVDTLARLKPGRQLYANVELYAGVVMASCGIPRQLFAPTFAAARTVGWCAHVLEQTKDNRLIRPLARYVGPPAPAPLPVAV